MRGGGQEEASLFGLSKLRKNFKSSELKKRKSVEFLPKQKCYCYLIFKILTESNRNVVEKEPF